jgi:AcrR family transcriptional regulator
MASTSYRARGRTKRSGETRARIMDATRELLDEGSFHESTVEQVGERAGVSRATVYQHFPSRLDLVDAMCDTFGVNPALVRIRDSVALEDLGEAMRESIADAMRFWSSEDSVLRQLYGVAAVDPAAQALVDRQLRDRRGEMQKLARRLDEGKMLRRGIDRAQALAQLMVLTSYGTYRDLHEEGLSDAKAIRTLQEMASRQLLRESAARGPVRPRRP